MDAFLIFDLVVFVLCILSLIRSNYTAYCGDISRKIISLYCDDLIEKREYKIGSGYFTLMQIPYFKHMFSIWLNGKYSRIKPEYKEILAPYFDKI